MAQILRLENPLFNPKLKLTLSQRICYFSATSHFFFGFPRLMYLIAPMLYLLLGINPVRGLGLETLFYALPHILLSMQTNHLPYKHVRCSFWNEIYEFAMSFQAGIVTLLALVNPKLGTFNVTDKGMTVDVRRFDFGSVRYLLILGVLTAASLAAVPFWLILSPLNTQSVLINTMWCLFNLLLVVAACLVGFEQPQLRSQHRLSRQMPIVLYSDTMTLWGTTVDISESGALVKLDEWPNTADRVRLEVTGDYGAKVLVDARIVRALTTPDFKTQIAVQFLNLNRAQKDDLSVLLFSDVDEWFSQVRLEVDRPLESLRFIASTMRRVFQEFQPASGMQMRQVVKAPIRFWIWRQLSQGRPILGLLVQPWQGCDAQSLLAQVREIDFVGEGVGDGAGRRRRDRKVILELIIPDSMRRIQNTKVTQLLQALAVL